MSINDNFGSTIQHIISIVDLDQYSITFFEKDAWQFAAISVPKCYKYKLIELQLLHIQEKFPDVIRMSLLDGHNDYILLLTSLK